MKSSKSRKRMKSYKPRRSIGIKWIAGFTMLLIALLSILYFQASPHQSPQTQRSNVNVDFSKAAIIDGIGLTKPNP